MYAKNFYKMTCELNKILRYDFRTEMFEVTCKKHPKKLHDVTLDEITNLAILVDFVHRNGDDPKHRKIVKMVGKRIDSLMVEEEDENEDEEEEESYEEEKEEKVYNLRKRVRETKVEEYYEVEKKDKKSRPTSSYPVDKAMTNSVKEEINKKFVELSIHASWAYPSSNIVYLDGPSICTSKLFVDSVLPTPVNLIVPNVPDYDAVKESLEYAHMTSRVELRNEWLSETLVHLKSKHISSIWMDYMCTLYGNKDISNPMDDIKYLFASGCLRTGSIFAITLCKRIHLDHGDARSNAITFIEREAKNNGYKLYSQLVKDYGVMFFLCYYVELID